MIMFGVSGVCSIARKYRSIAPIASRIPTIAISFDFMGITYWFVITIFKVSETGYESD
jgi:hypothetical protein